VRLGRGIPLVGRCGCLVLSLKLGLWRESCACCASRVGEDELLLALLGQSFLAPRVLGEGIPHKLLAMSV
jgi:hypothetical protein